MALRVLRTRGLLPSSLRLLALLPLLALASSCATVSTNTPSSVTTNSALLGGVANTTASTSTITARGVILNTNPNNLYIGGPGTTQVQMAGPGNGGFSQVVTGLTPNTLYYVSAYANVTDTQQGSGTVNGVPLSFTTRGLLAPPVVATPANGSTTTNPRPTYSGTAPAGSTVNVYVDNASIGTTVALGGNFSLVQPTNLSNASHTVYATAQTAVDGISVNSNTNTFTVSAVQAPTTTISTSAGANGTSTSVSPIPFTVTFASAVTGFTASDVVVSNGLVSNFIGSGTSYTFDVTPNAAGPVTVNVPANSATDSSSGLGNVAAAPYTISYIPPGTPTPAVTVPANGSSTNNPTPTYSGTAAAGSTVTVYVDNNAIGLTVANGSGNWTLPQPQASPLASGSHTVSATAQLPGQTMSLFSSANTFTVDTAAPTATVTSTTAPSGGSTTASPIRYVVTFSESVTGFNPSGVSVGNGSIAGFTGSGTTYSFDVVPTGPGLVTVTVLANAAQDAAGNGNTVSNPYQITFAPTAVTWTGSVNTDWFSVSNWTPATVPTATTDATIPGTAPRMPSIGANAAVKTLTINSGATLSHAAGTLTVTGNLTNNGTYAASGTASAGATLSLGSTALSSLFGSGTTRFWNLSVEASGAQLSTSAGAAVQRVLTLNGNLATNGNPLTLESNASGTAMVVNNGSAAVTGNVTVQRYITPDLNPNLGYRHVASPVATATVASLTTTGFAPVVNPAYNGSASPSGVRPFPTVYGYNQARLATTTNDLPTFDKGWYSPAALSDPLAVGVGYTVLAPANLTWNFTGALNNNDITLNLGRNTGATAADAGLHLVGNPYPAPLNWQLALADHPGVDDVIYQFTSNNPADPYTGTYGFYNNGIGNISPVLPVGQGFFVRVTQGQTFGTLTLKNSHRVTAYQSLTYHRTTETRPVVHLTLHGANLQDDAFVYAETGATTGMDAGFDGEKLPNTTGLNLSSAAAGHDLCVNGLPAFTAGTVVPLSVGVPTAGAYTLRAAELLNLPAGTAAVLVDAQLGTRTDLAALPAGYAFTVTPAQASALVRGRFFLNLVPAAAPLATAGSHAVQPLALFPNPAAHATTTLTGAQAGAKVTVTDAVGRVVLTATASAAGTAQLALPEGSATGVYVVRSGAQALKLVVE